MPGTPLSEILHDAAQSKVTYLVKLTSVSPSEKTGVVRFFVPCRGLSVTEPEAVRFRLKGNSLLLVLPWAWSRKVTVSVTKSIAAEIGIKVIEKLESSGFDVPVDMELKIGFE